MAIRRYFREPPKQQPVVRKDGTVDQSWSAHFDALARPGKATDVDTTYDPASIAAGAAQRVNVTVPGCVPMDFVVASHSQTTVDVGIDAAWVSAADQVTVVLRNYSGGPIDLPSGTIRVRFWSHNP